MINRYATSLQVVITLCLTETYLRIAFAEIEKHLSDNTMSLRIIYSAKVASMSNQLNNYKKNMTATNFTSIYRILSFSYLLCIVFYEGCEVILIQKDK